MKCGVVFIFLYLMVTFSIAHGQGVNPNPDPFSEHDNVSVTIYEWSEFLSNCSKYVNAWILCLLGFCRHKIVKENIIKYDLYGNMKFPLQVPMLCTL